MMIKSGQRKRSSEDQISNLLSRYIFYLYRGKQGRESEEHDGHDEVDNVADGEDYQESVELPLELLAAEHKNGNEISRNPQNSHTRLVTLLSRYFIYVCVCHFVRFYLQEAFPPQTI